MAPGALEKKSDMKEKELGVKKEKKDKDPMKEKKSKDGKDSKDKSKTKDAKESKKDKPEGKESKKDKSESKSDKPEKKVRISPCALRSFCCVWRHLVGSAWLLGERKLGA